MSSIEDTRIIIEFVRVGAYVKVSAIDPVTRVEVSIVGDPAKSEATLERAAVKKLDFVLTKKGLKNR
ncbi:MAG: hypothetical protein CMM58_08145 [Rhodospirillaceae bacterium]|nr:hypothetical protein [Rhodospirillaceae bacterium]|tara:strand:- start:468 stop:668 length:201 start_codon:yes stop_codon:yes gene_type:complete